jgi:uncharacterized membrane protein YjfL (UPF0719 family)
MTSADWQDIWDGLAYTLAYVGVSVVLLALGFALLDRLTPGRLGEVIMAQRNKNAARVAAAGMIGLSIVIGTAVITTHDNFTVGLISTSMFGLVGVILQGVVFFALDKLTPGNLGDVVCDPEDHPGSLVVAASLIAAGLLVAACIS